MTICESDMVFGEFDEADCFHIEKTTLYKRLSSDKLKSVEFVLHRPERNELFFVEAKTTFPAFINSEVVLSAEDNVNSFSTAVTAISQKFMDSLLLACSIWFGKNNAKIEIESVIPKNKESFFTYGKQIVFVLVIKNCKTDLTTIADNIKKEIRKRYLILGFKVLVLDEDFARKIKLVI